MFFKLSHPPNNERPPCMLIIPMLLSDTFIFVDPGTRFEFSFPVLPFAPLLLLFPPKLKPIANPIVKIITIQKQHMNNIFLLKIK